MSEKIALGFGNNIDYEIVWDSTVLEALVAQYGIHQDELDVHKPILSERDLVISILSFLQGADGGERFVATPDIIEQFSQQFEKKITLGGTSVRAAVAMRKLGFKSALHLVTINDHVRRLIPQDSPYVCSSTADNISPHLIVQFGKGTCVAANDIEINAHQPNRIIYHSDHENITMLLNEDFAGLLAGAKILLVAGFNAMQQRDLLQNRLDTVLGFIHRLPQDALVFCEEAGYYDDSFRHEIYRTLDGKIDIVSLNEDEAQTHLGRKLNLLDVGDVKAAIVELQQTIGTPIIVMHTKHWALAYGENAARFTDALKSGVTMATTRFCCGDDFTVADYAHIESLPPDDATANFVNAINDRQDDTLVCVAVAHVDQTEGTTVGLGDTFVAGFLSAASTL